MKSKILNRNMNFSKKKRGVLMFKKRAASSGKLNRDVYSCSITLCKDEGGFIVVKCKELDVATQGKTVSEAISNIKEAISSYLLAFPEEHKNLKMGLKGKECKKLELPFSETAQTIKKAVPAFLF